MRRPKSLAAVLAAACLLAAGAAPATAQNIDNPIGTAFNGFNPAPLVFDIGGVVTVQCITMTPVGSPTPPKGVVANALGGPSTKMARFHPLFNQCSAMVGGAGPFNATMVANCDWAYAVDAFNNVTGASALRLQIGLGGCANPLDAVTISVPGAGCTVGLHQQPLIHNGGSISITGQDTPWPPPPASLRITHTITAAIQRTAAGCGVGNPNPLGSMSVPLQLSGVWAGP